jgi:hypothetical protein
VSLSNTSSFYWSPWILWTSTAKPPPILSTLGSQLPAGHPQAISARLCKRTGPQWPRPTQLCQQVHMCHSKTKMKRQTMSSSHSIMLCDLHSASQVWHLHSDGHRPWAMVAVGVRSWDFTHTRQLSWAWGPTGPDPRFRIMPAVYLWVINSCLACYTHMCCLAWLRWLGENVCRPNFLKNEGQEALHRLGSGQHTSSEHRVPRLTMNLLVLLLQPSK